MSWGKKTGSAPVSFTDSHVMTVEKCSNDSFMLLGPIPRANLKLFVKTVVVSSNKYNLRITSFTFSFPATQLLSILADGATALKSSSYLVKKKKKKIGLFHK